MAFRQSKTASFLVSLLAWFIAFIIAGIFQLYRHAQGFLLCLYVSAIFMFVRFVIGGLLRVPPCRENFKQK